MGIVVVCAVAAAGLCLFVFRPKAAAVSTVLIVMFGLPLQAVTGIGAISRLDELTVIAAVLVFPALTLFRDRRPLRRLAGGRWFLLYLAAGLLSGLLRRVPLPLLGQGMLLSGKGIAFGWAVAQLDWTEKDLRRLGRVAVAVLGVIFAGGAVNAVAPGPWNALFATEHYVARGGAVATLIGPFTLPGSFGTMMALAAGAIVAYTAAFGRWNGRTGLALAGAVLGTILTFRRRLVPALLAAMLAGRSKPGKPWGALVITFAFPLAAVALIASTQIGLVVSKTATDYNLHSGAARVRLYQGAAQVSGDYFPLGAGFARYGSYLSGVHYSPEYVRLGYENVYGLTPNAPSGAQFFTDTFWPEALGETGLLGTVGFAFGLVGIWRYGRRLARAPSPVVCCLGLIMSAWSVEFVIESFAAPVYFSPPGYALLFGVAGLTSALVKVSGAHEAVVADLNGDGSVPEDDGPRRPIGQDVVADLNVGHRRSLP